MICRTEAKRSAYDSAQRYGAASTAGRYQRPQAQPHPYYSAEWARASAGRTAYRQPQGFARRSAFLQPCTPCPKI